MILDFQLGEFVVDTSFEYVSWWYPSLFLLEMKKFYYQKDKNCLVFGNGLVSLANKKMLLVCSSQN